MNLYLIGAGVVVGILVTAIFDRWWFSRKLRKLATGIGELFGGVSTEVPPFRISLSEDDDVAWRDKRVIKKISKELKRLGYEQSGDFVIPQLDNIALRGFANANTNTYAAIYEQHESGKVVADVFCDFDDTNRLTMSSAPDDGLDRPEFAPITNIRVDLNGNPIAVIEVHEALIARRGSRGALSVNRNGFEDAYVTGYSKLMDWRLTRGTITADEVRRIASRSGDSPPAEKAIKAAQDSWREKMTEFITHLIRERFRNTETLSGQEWGEKEERFFFVYEQMDVEGTIDTFAWHVADKDQHREDHDESDEASEGRFTKARAKLAEVFANVSARQGFKAAQPLLPENRRYNFISKIVGEFPADIYLKPENEDDYDDIFED